MEYVRRDEKSDRKVYGFNNIPAGRMAKFQSGGKTGHLGNNE